MYLCMSTYGDSGPCEALLQLRDFYLDIRTEEETKDVPETTLKELNKLVDMPFNYPERIPLERSSTYIGLKLLWAIRLFLQGKKFPKHHFPRPEWRTLCHDVIDLITEASFMQTLLEIDASAFFQVLSLVFQNPSAQYTFISEPRPPQSPEKEEKESMSLDLIVSRVQKFMSNLAPNDPVSLRFLCFVSSVCDSYQNISLEQNFYLHSVTELLANHALQLGFNKNRLKQLPSPYTMYRKLSRRGNHAPDDLKHIQLT